MADTNQTTEVKVKEERHATLYFEDGDLVISAASQARANVLQLFRIHGTLLAIHSPVFKDMLVIGADSGNEQYDGVAKVHLPDNSEDVAGLLDALYGRPLPLKRLNADNPLNARGIMTLAVKYDMETIRNAIIERIAEDWPSTLMEWESREQEMKHKMISRPLHETPFWFNEYKLFPEPASAIRFAMDFNCPTILPAAFYALVRGYHLWEWGENLDSQGVAARWSLLTAPDLMKLFTGKSVLVGESNNLPGRLERAVYPCKRTAGRTPCLEVARECINHVALHRMHHYCTDPLRFCMDLVEEYGRRYDKFCCEEGCRAFSTAIAQAAQDLWGRLPGIFELDTGNGSQVPEHGDLVGVLVGWA